MKEIRFRAWHLKEGRMYFRAYQKWLHVLLCDDDRGTNGGRGTPVKRAGYADCVLLESTGIFDRRNIEIFEGDLVRILHAGREALGVVPAVPDTFGSRVHPLVELFARHGIDPASKVEIEVIGNEFETPAAAEGKAG